MGSTAEVFVVAFATAGKAPAAATAREELGGEASTASASWAAGMGGRPWSGRLVLGRLSAATEGGGIGYCGGYHYTEAAWYRAVQYPSARRCPWRIWQPWRSYGGAGEWVKLLMLGKVVGLQSHQWQGSSS